MRPVRAVGTVKHDETRLTIVTMRSDGYIEELFVNKTGQHVHAGEPLFRVYSPDIVQAQVDFQVAMRALERGAGGATDAKGLAAFPQARVREPHTRGARRAKPMPRTIDWPSPATGDIIEKNGHQRAKGHCRRRALPDRGSLAFLGHRRCRRSATCRQSSRDRATVIFRAYMMQPIEGEVTLIYPELRPETRTARVRIEVPNPDGRLKTDMYADVVFQAGADEPPVIAVPASAMIDSGTRQVVLVAKGEGRFEPRPVKLGRRGDGYVEVLEGVASGEEVVTSATFLIDAESNLSGAAGVHASRRRRNDRRAHPLVGAQRLPGRALRPYSSPWPASTRSRACRSMPFPDLSDVQVIVYTEYPGQAPQVVEDQVTYPLTTAMLSVPKSRVVRGFSFFGVSFVYVIFEDGTDLYWARSRVLEYLSSAARRLPPGSPRASVRTPPASAGSTSTSCAAPRRAWPSCAPSRTGTCATASPRRKASPRWRASAASSSTTAW